MHANYPIKNQRFDMTLSYTTPVASTQSKFYTHALWTLFFLVVCRLLAMYFMPLNDSTEARYGEISRIMLETGNWVTPMHYYGEPFWAKPPLSTWFSAFSMKLFGVNALAVRLPALVLSMIVLWLVGGLSQARDGNKVAVSVVLVLAGTVYFFLDAGAVMTDPSLLCCTTLILVSFWRVMADPSRLWGYLFFVGVGLGLLAKGPVALVLTGIPIFFWVLLHKKWHALWKNIPWVSGLLLTLLIALPWYLLAESRTPGFLNYFLVGEHVSRFMQPGWTGDKYGFAHEAPFGMIWAYALLGMLPWSIIGLVWLVRQVKKIPALYQDKDGWVSYLVLATFLPLLFFTFAGNIIYPYVFPSLPTFALLFVELANRTHSLTDRNLRYLVRFASITGFVFLLVTLAFVFMPERVEKSQKRVIEQWKNQHPTANSRLIYWTKKTTIRLNFTRQVVRKRRMSHTFYISCSRTMKKITSWQAR